MFIFRVILVREEEMDPLDQRYMIVCFCLTNLDSCILLNMGQFPPSNSVICCHIVEGFSTA